MKKLVAFFLTVLLLIPCACAEMTAESNVVIALPGVQVTFTPVAGGICLTRESSASAFNRVGMSQREILPYMEEYDLYAMMYDGELTMEMQLSVYQTGEADYADLNAFEAAALCDDYEQSYASFGYDVESVEMVQSGGYDYVCMRAMHAYEDGYEERMLYYSTVRGGYALELVVFPYEGPVTEAIETQTMTVLESIRVEPVTLDMLPEGYGAIELPGFQAYFELPEGMTTREADDAAMVLTPADGAWEIVFRVTKGDGGDLDLLSDEMAKVYCEDVRTEREGVVEAVSAAEIYASAVHRYVRIVAREKGEDGQSRYYDEYFTKQEGWDVSVAAVSTGAELTDGAEKTLREIIDSLMISAPVSEE